MRSAGAGAPGRAGLDLPGQLSRMFFSEPGLLAHFHPHYELLATFPAIDHPQLAGASASAKGMIFQLRP
jgi:hypothetical protein